MDRICFKCTLLSDVVISSTSATQGNKKTLDFIPGNNFLGIVAGHIYKEENDETFLLFHSGKVRFGDAHPSKDGNRGLRVPASMFYPKMSKPSDGCYIHHLIINPEVQMTLQLKQCREGFYAFSETEAQEIETDKNFSIKSSYDSTQRRSKDSAMFGYEALARGLVLYFDVEVDDEAAHLKDKIVSSLCGKRHVGRSKTAQYGLVEIEQSEFTEVSSASEGVNVNGEIFSTVYADGRLIFLDENGEPTFTPSAADLGVAEDRAEIDYEKSQIRTFQYAPWNYKRQSHDTERCGIEKGSVFVVKCKTAPKESQYVGTYCNEGFGKVIYNPYFLKAEDGNADGKAVCSLKEKENPAQEKKIPAQEKETQACNAGDSLLVSYLMGQKQLAEDEKEIYKFVNRHVEEWKRSGVFKGDAFASQWGSIRSIAMTISDSERLKTEIQKYIEHGVAADKWKENDRGKKLMKIMNEVTNPKDDVKKAKDNVAPYQLCDVIINLSSEMAKLCK